MAHNNNTASELIIIKPTTTKLAEDDGYLVHNKFMLRVWLFVIGVCIDMLDVVEVLDEHKLQWRTTTIRHQN